MCRSTAAPIMAMVGMAGTAVGIGIAVLKEKADRRSFKREAEAEIAELDEIERRRALGEGSGAAADEPESDGPDTEGEDDRRDS